MEKNNYKKWGFLWFGIIILMIAHMLIFEFSYLNGQPFSFMVYHNSGLAFYGYLIVIFITVLLTIAGICAKSRRAYADLFVTKLCIILFFNFFIYVLMLATYHNPVGFEWPFLNISAVIIAIAAIALAILERIHLRRLIKNNSENNTAI